MADYERERAKVVTQGWGARLIAEQSPDGTWAGLYSPKWTSTFYTMQLLWQLGLPRTAAAAQRGAAVLSPRGFARDGGFRLDKRPNPALFGETCESGMALAILTWFTPDDPLLFPLRERLLQEQFEDGGWNCQSGAAHSSFNTTILVLEGLLEWERRPGTGSETAAARRRAEEFLLAHRMFRSHTTGEVVRKQYTLLSFPGRWHYDVLRGLDYLAAAEAPRDSRATEAVELVRSKRRGDGRWPLQHRHSGVTYFEMEAGREASRWNTLRAMRMLRWWDGE